MKDLWVHDIVTCSMYGNTRTTYQQPIDDNIDLEEVTFNSDGTVVYIVNKSETTRGTFETSNGR